MEIQKAIPQDAVLLKKIMLLSKAHWGYTDDWMAHWGERLSITPTNVSDHEVYMARENPQSVIGFYAIKLYEKTCVLDELWILPKWIGKGMGRLLFTHALNRASNLGADEMIWEAEPHAVGFYQHIGAHRIRYIDDKLEGYIPVMGMKVVSSPSAISQ